MAFTIAIICVALSNCAELGEYICFGKPTDTLIPHPNECNSFFLCDGGVGYKNTCPDNSYFNPNLGGCDPDYKDCISEGDGTTPTSGFPTATTSQPTTETSDETTIPTSPPLPNCPPEDTNNLTFLRNPENCDEFYLCYYGKPILFRCSIGFHYSDELKGCVPPKEAKCIVSCIDNDL